jgi:hypothetical protein
MILIADLTTLKGANSNPIAKKVSDISKVRRITVRP